MKKIATISFLIGAIICSISATAQKIGHISLDSVLKSMPESDSAKKQYANYAGQLQSTFDSFQKEFQQKYQDYQANQATLTGIAKQSREQDLQDLQQRIQAFQQQAQVSLQKFGDSIQKPVIFKAKAAIAAVAKDGQYKYVLDTSGQGFVLFAESSDDLFDAVMKKLGDKPKAASVPTKGGK